MQLSLYPRNIGDVYVRSRVGKESHCVFFVASMSYLPVSAPHQPPLDEISSSVPSSFSLALSLSAQLCRYQYQAGEMLTNGFLHMLTHASFHKASVHSTLGRTISRQSSRDTISEPEDDAVRVKQTVCHFYHIFTTRHNHHNTATDAT